MKLVDSMRLFHDSGNDPEWPPCHFQETGTLSQVEWADVGTSTVSHVETIIKCYQPLTWRLLNSIEVGPAVRKRRPTSTASF